MWLKSCPRCAGDLYREVDIQGPSVCCLQCGHQLTDDQLAALIHGGASGAKAERRNTPRPSRRATADRCA
jgi:hypothetical protein